MPRKTKKTEKDQVQVQLQLTGKVYLVETKAGKKIKTEIDGQVVLRCLLVVLEQALRSL